MSAYPEMNLNILERSQSPSVWVMNITRGDARSIVHLTVPKLTGGGDDKVEIPVTSIPVNLTDQVPKRQLLASGNFRKAISRQFLRLISEEEAETLLSQPAAQKELNRLQSETDAFTSGVPTVTFTNTDNIRPRIQSLTALMEEGVEDEVIHTLNAIGELNKDEADYLTNKAKELKFNEVQQLIKSLVIAVE